MDANAKPLGHRHEVRRTKPEPAQMCLQWPQHFEHGRKQLVIHTAVIPAGGRPRLRIIVARIRRALTSSGPVLPERTVSGLKGVVLVAVRPAA
jgi:hypothetical protein